MNLNPLFKWSRRGPEDEDTDELDELDEEIEDGDEEDAEMDED